MPKGGKTKITRAVLARLAKTTSAASKIQRAYRRKKTQGLTKVERKQVKGIVKSRKETKYSDGWIRYDDFENITDYFKPPIAGQAVLPGVFDATQSPVTSVVLQMGYYKSGTSDELNAIQPNWAYPLGGLEMSQGTDIQQIVGEHCFMQSCKLQLRINANAASFESVDAVAKQMMLPLEFRVLHLRGKNNVSTEHSLLKNCFLDNIGDREGLGGTMSVKEVMRDIRVNTNQFDLVKEYKFRLSQPIDPTGISSLGVDLNGAGATYFPNAMLNPIRAAYPNHHDLDIWMNRPKKKLRFSPSDTGVNNHEPTNYAFDSEFIVILCARDGTYGSAVATPQPNPDSVSTAKNWNVRVNGMTKYRDA